jgi:cysteine desulfurase
VIYADNAATTRLSEAAFEKMLPFLREQYGNASSRYTFGVKAKRVIEEARRQVAVAIGAEPSEIAFTSGGSEGNSWVIQGIARLFNGENIHVVASSIEHHSVLNACRKIETCGVSVTYVPVDSVGRISVRDVASSIRPNTKLVSVMFANNEIGTIQPIAEIGKYLREKDVLFHTDAVQAVGHIPVNVKDLQLDFLTASAHKFNGAKGTGFLYKRSGIDLPQLIFGGEQEHGQRAGTENVAGITAMGYALEESVADMSLISEKLTALAETSINGLKAEIPEIRINGQGAERLPGIVNITFPYASGEAVMRLLDLKEVCVSTSSACNSGKDEASHVLLALGLSEKQAKSSIRISYGRYNAMEEAERIVSTVSDVYAKIIANHNY